MSGEDTGAAVGLVQSYAGTRPGPAIERRLNQTFITHKGNGARWPHQRGMAVEQFRRGQEQWTVPALAGIGALIEQAFGVRYAEPFQGER